MSESSKPSGGSMSVQQALAMARRVLWDTAGGEGRALTADEAQAVFAELGDLRNAAVQAKQRAGVLEKRSAALSGEVNQLVGQVVTEEVRAVKAEARLAEACALLRGWCSDERNRKRWVDRAQRFLAEVTK